MVIKNFLSSVSQWFVLLIFVFLPICSYSEEDNWKLIGKSRTETLWFTRMDTLSNLHGDVISVWLKTVPAKTDTDFLEGEESIESILMKIQARNFRDYVYTLGLWELGCSKDIFRILYFAAYNDRGEVVASSLTPDSEWSSIMGGSVAQTMHEILCEHPRKENNLPQSGEEIEKDK